MSVSSEKAELRSRYRFERRERYVDHSFSYLVSSSEFSKANVIASYISYRDEPNTDALNKSILDLGKDLYLPRINGNSLDWVRWTGDKSDLSPSKMSKEILEPTGDILTDLSLIQLVVVPALRIDRAGYRLGQGGGFYDRALTKLSAWSIGLIHPDEISSSDLPREDFDIPLNAAATPDLIIRFN